MSVPTKEQLKARSKHLAQLLQDKYNVKISHGHCLDVISQLFGFKDWNTASASSPTEEPKLALSERRQQLIEALKQDFDVTVEQPYFEEQYHVGGATASHKTEKGVTVFGNFHLRVDEQKRAVALILPEVKRETSSDILLSMNKQGYLQREKLFAEKLGGSAKDFAR